ncbi:MAG: hypothetical protein MIO88_03945 [Methanoregulaceae archaeon]|nr:hypothetical protein [Methanoregulaceae archaeon]
MATKLPIPEEVRWQAAARIASIIPVLYRTAFQELAGDRFDELEQQVWIVLAHEATTLAATFNLPVGTAKELASTLSVITTVFFGPETTTEVASFEGDRAVLLVKRCPFLLREAEFRAEPGSVFNRCLAFSIAAVEALNPDYTLRFVRGACHGDRNCEMKITTKAFLGEKKEQRKKKNDDR